MTLREEYQPIIIELTARIDNASRKHVLTGDLDALDTYNSLTAAIGDIKDIILRSERNSNV